MRTVCLQLKNFPKKEFLELISWKQQIAKIYVDWAFENKSWFKKQAHIDLYSKIRKQFPRVPSAIIQTIRDQMLEACKSVKLETRPKTDSKTIRYDRRTLTLQGEKLSLSTQNERFKIILKVPDCHKQYFRSKKWRIQGATIHYYKNKLWIHLNFKSTEYPSTKIEGEFVGIDRGLYNLAVTSKDKRFGGRPLRNIRRKYLYLRRQLKAKSTRSAKRKLKQISGKEKRFSKQINHVISKELASDQNVKVYILEDLRGIRKKRKGKKLNKLRANWSYFQFEQFLTYKCLPKNIGVVKVDPRYTSQKCSVCSHTNRKNRKGSIFLCQACGNKMNSDLNAAINIRNNYLLSLKQEQAPVNVPYEWGHSNDSRSSPQARPVGS